LQQISLDEVHQIPDRIPFWPLLSLVYAQTATTISRIKQ